MYNRSFNLKRTHSERKDVWPIVRLKSGGAFPLEQGLVCGSQIGVHVDRIDRIWIEDRSRLVRIDFGISGGGDFRLNENYVSEQVRPEKELIT
jgi:hypothetical protein